MFPNCMFLVVFLFAFPFKKVLCNHAEKVVVDNTLEYVLPALLLKKEMLLKTHVTFSSASSC